MATPDFYVITGVVYCIGLTRCGLIIDGCALVIPALSARLLAHSPKQMVIWSFILAQLGVSIGLWSSAALNISTGIEHCFIYGTWLCADFYRTKIITTP